MRVLVALALIALVCAGADDLPGEYSASMPEVASGLLLRPDRTFEYFFIYGAADFKSQGTWRTEGRAVVLDTSGKEEPPFRLVKSTAGNKSEVLVHVQAPNGRGIAHMEITLTTASGNSEARTGSDGVAVLSRKGMPKSISIHVPVYDVDAGPFDVAENAGELWFEINGDAITQVRFRKESLKITDSGLEMTFWNKDKPLRYRKQ